MSKEQFFELKPRKIDSKFIIEGKELYADEAGIFEFDIVAQPYSILIEAPLNEVSLYEPEYRRRFIYIGDNKAYEDYKIAWIKDYSPLDRGKISEVYKSMNELLEDLDRGKIRKSLIDEIRERGHVSFPVGERC